MGLGDKGKRLKSWGYFREMENGFQKKKEENVKVVKENRKWKKKGWERVVGAVVVALVATALVFVFDLSLFFKDSNSCHCSQVLSLSVILSLRLWWRKIWLSLHAVFVVLILILGIFDRVWIIIFFFRGELWILAVGYFLEEWNNVGKWVDLALILAFFF